MKFSRTRLVFATFAIVSVAVGINALFLQKGRHPAPLTMSAPDKTASIAPAPRRHDPLGALIGTHAAVGKPEASGGAATLVQSIQLKLKGMGYDPGPADGLNGPMTQAAIMAYQTDNQRPVTGEADAGLLRLLRGEHPYAPVSAGGPKPLNGTSLALIKDIQKSLTAFGYEAGEADGIVGAGTRNAIQRFERDHSLDVTGRISGKLLRKLQERRGRAGRLS